MSRNRIRELLVISGKGGTGKTSVTASFAVLAGDCVLADCDVDAADLHLILSPAVREEHVFESGNIAIIRNDSCTSCGFCTELCRFDAIQKKKNNRFEIDRFSCEGCGVCVRFCPSAAIDFPERRNGKWMISDTRCGPMAHARLTPGAENSGKLVSTVRENAFELAVTNGKSLIISDGPPGIGCPVISSLSGASLTLIVVEPSVSGLHDLERVLALARHFSVPAAVCVNKWDINHELTEKIEDYASSSGASVLTRIRYDRTVTEAQLQQKATVELDCPAAMDISELWKQVYKLIESGRN